MNKCRFGYYERGTVTRHIAGRSRADVPQNEPSAPAKLRAGPEGIKIVEIEMDGAKWFGRLMQKKPGLIEGPVILHEQPAPKNV